MNSGVVVSGFGRGQRVNALVCIKKWEWAGCCMGLGSGLGWFVFVLDLIIRVRMVVLVQSPRTKHAISEFLGV